MWRGGPVGARGGEPHPASHPSRSSIAITCTWWATPGGPRLASPRKHRSRDMHIAILSDDEAGGGANIAGRRLAESFLAAGHRITRIYQTAERDDARWDTRLIPSLMPTHELPFALRAAVRIVP